MAGWVLCTTLVLAALAGAQETRYEKFLRQHVDNPRTSELGHRYCETMLARRAVNVQGGPCKVTNTFVHAPAKDLVAACSQVPDPTTGFHSTPRTLSLTVCRLRSGAMWPSCTYTASQPQQHVVVACENGQPVHLEKTYP